MDTHQGLDMKKRAGQANGHRRVPSSRELRPVPGGRRRRPRGELGGGGGWGRAAGNFGGERRALPRGGRGSSERSLAGEEVAGTGGEAAGAGWGAAEGGGTSQLPPRAARARQPRSPPSSSGGAPSPARSHGL
uniref:Uncharacterized protein n=1 Tax=Corvus moneduloides TaxID=1196302 RepID=A0A8U7MBR1_CORMO